MMEEFVFIEDGDYQKCLKLSICQPAKTTIKDIVLTIKKNLEKDEIASSILNQNYHVYYIPESFLSPNKTAVEITDHSSTIASINQNLDFDLIISKQFPIILNDPESSFTNNSKISACSDSEKFENILGMAQLSMRANDLQNAVSLIKNAQQLNPTDPRPLHYLLELSYKTHNYEKARKFANNVISHFPNDAQTHIIFGKTLQKLNRHLEAIWIFNSITLLKDAPVNKIHTLIAYSKYALGDIEGAIFLVDQVLKCEPSNSKALFLAVKILVENKLFVRACSMIFYTSVHQVSFIFLQKFIRHFVDSKEKCKILLAESGDKKEDYKFLFLIGKTLFDVGRCDLSLSFFKQAFEKMPSIPVVGLFYMKCLIYLGKPKEEIIETAKKLLSNSFYLYDKSCTVFTDILEKPFEVTNTKLTRNLKQRKDIESFFYEENESPFSIDQLDTIVFISNLQNYFFINGYIDAAEKLTQSILPIVQPFNLTKTIISDTASTFILISSIIGTIPSIPYMIAEKESEYCPIYVIGGTPSLIFAHQELQLDNSKYVFLPVYIENLSIDDIRKTSKTANHYMFDRLIHSIPDKSNVLFFIGDIDCSQYAYDAYSLRYDSVDEAYLNPINSYVESIKAIQDEKHLHIVIHSVPTASISIKECIPLFNKELISAFKTSQLENVHVFSLPEELLVNSQLHPEYVLNDLYVKPSYIDKVGPQIVSNFQ